MNIETAQAIMAAVVDAEILKQEEVPTDDDALIEEAQFYVGFAKAHPLETNPNETVERILALVEDGADDQGYVPAEQEPSEPLADKDEARTTAHTPPDMPYDVTALKDIEVRRLSSRFQVHLNEVVRELSVIQTQVLRAKQLRDAAYRTAYLAEANRSKDEGLKLTQAVLDMAATNAPAVREKDSEVFELEVKEREMKALRDIYKGNVDRLSRDLTMRADEMRSATRRH